MLLHGKIYKPCHVKLTNGPAEALLSYYLKENNFKIIVEQLGSVTTIYTVGYC